jgi:RNA polymerase sigma-70 factor (ECF subfamily)
VDPEARARVEHDLKERCEKGDHDGAAAALIRAYGPEILGFLAALQGGHAEAEEVFSLVAEAIWKGMAGFAWEASARSWAYAIARNAARTRFRDEARRRRRQMNRSSAFFEEVVQQVRTETSAFLRTARRTRLQELRDSLEEEDRALLVLRVDRDLSWKELASVLSDGDEALDEEGLAREAARLRKRFQVVKDRLRELARREGLVE